MEDVIKNIVILINKYYYLDADDYGFISISNHISENTIILNSKEEAQKLILMSELNVGDELVSNDEEDSLLKIEEIKIALLCPQEI